jgi:hypothetical protein
MKRPSPVKQDEVLRDILVPVLAEATIGRFDQDVPMDGQPPDVTEVLVGVQSLIEVVRQQQQRLEEVQLRLQHVQLELQQTRERTSEILTEVLERSLKDRA